MTVSTTWINEKSLKFLHLFLELITEIKRFERNF